jgi:holo-[acyl-carrier protein] synthase
MTEIFSGVDIVANNKIKRMMEKSGNELKDIFSEEEIKYCFSKKDNYQSFAVRFAAKEAFLKAIDKGVFDFELTEIEILNTVSGRPYINIRSEKIRKSVENILKKMDFRIVLSVSHEKEYSIAQVIIY